MNSRAAPERPWVLVVDDDEEVRDILDLVLEQADIDRHTVPGGAAALAVLASRPAPAAALIDLRMPEMSGAELVTEMRRRPCLAGVPVVVVSGDAGAPATAEELGARACLRKPFDLDALVDTLRSLLPTGAPAGGGPPTGEPRGWRISGR